MKRRRPSTAAELEAARKAAEEARVRAGLEASEQDFCVPRGERFRVTSEGRVIPPKSTRQAN